jgi:hypothetical protein
MKTEPTKELRTKDGRYVGYLKGNVFRKIVESSKHTFRKLDAWGIDYEVLHKELPEKCAIRILDKEENVLYLTTATIWREKGTVMRFNKNGREDWPQSFLPKDYFDRVRNAT